MSLGSPQRIEGRVVTGSRDLPPGPVAKVCGITRLKDLLQIAETGVWAVGFVFAPSPRRVTASEVEELLGEAARARASLGRVGGPAGGPRSKQRHGASLGRVGGPLAVGVFGDGSAEEIVRVADQARLDAIQLHGARGPLPSEVRRLLGDRTPPLLLGCGGIPAATSTLIMRAVAVELEEDNPRLLKERVDLLCDAADVVLLDTRSKGLFGGTGISFPWSLAREVCGEKRVLIAGGVRPENVREALRLSGAWGVDVSSGLETSPGIKDFRAVKALMEALRGGDDWAEPDRSGITRGG